MKVRTALEKVTWIATEENERKVTRCRRRTQVDILAVVSEASFVVSSDAQHVNAIRVHVLHNGAGASDFLPPLPQFERLALGLGPPELHRVVPGGWRMLRQAPAEEDLVVGVRPLRVDHRSLRGCNGRGERKARDVRPRLSGAGERLAD